MSNHHIKTRCPTSPIPAIAFALLAASSPASIGAVLNEPVKPIPDSVAVDPRKVELGKKLFHEKRLSVTNTISCSSCHPLDDGGADGKRVSDGVNGNKGDINAPTVFNSGLQFAQFWDGRSATLEGQIGEAVQDPSKLGSLWSDVVAKLYEDPLYPQQFNAIYADGINRNNIRSAIAEYERSLITPNSRFDQYLRGNPRAINRKEKYGYQLFKHYGCSSCHQGAAVGGNMFQIFGVFGEYFQQRGDISKADLGRYRVTGNSEDRHLFKVPSLRMAALTAPYLHDGSAKTLREAVDTMFKYQLGREAPQTDKDAIVAFLKTLPGEYKGKGL